MSYIESISVSLTLRRADLERCYALYGITVNERIKEWLKLEVKRLEGSSYDAITQSLDSIQYVASSISSDLD